MFYPCDVRKALLPSRSAPLLIYPCNSSPPLLGLSRKNELRAGLWSSSVRGAWRASLRDTAASPRRASQGAVGARAVELADGAVLTDDKKTELLSCSVPPVPGRGWPSNWKETMKSIGRVAEEREGERLWGTGDCKPAHGRLAWNPISGIHHWGGVRWGGQWVRGGVQAWRRGISSRSTKGSVSLFLVY